MNAIQNITIGQPDRLKKPVGYTILSNLVNIIPFCLSIEAIDVIFRAFDGNGTPLDTTRYHSIMDNFRYTRHICSRHGSGRKSLLPGELP